YGELLERRGNRSAGCVPQGVYRTLDVDDDGTSDRWVAISVADDAQWRALCAVLGAHDWARDAALTRTAGRRTREDEIDARLENWCATRSTRDIVDRLSAAGVPAEPVVRAHEHDRLEQMMWRKLFERVDHPVTGAA